MRRFALTTAMVGFLVLAGIALACGARTFDATMRALAGAAVLYFVVSIGGKAALSIMVDAVVNSVPRTQDSKDTES